MEGVIIAVELLLLLAGYILFQQAKSELNAKAAQLPILSEVKALQKSVAALIEQIKLEASQTSAQLEARCAEARDLLAALDRRLDEAPIAPSRASVRRRNTISSESAAARADRQVPAPAPGPEPRLVNPRNEAVYALADEGLEATAIAQRTGLSEGEVEMILGLRAKVS